LYWSGHCYVVVSGYMSNGDSLKGCHDDDDDDNDDDDDVSFKWHMTVFQSQMSGF